MIIIRAIWRKRSDEKLSFGRSGENIGRKIIIWTIWRKISDEKLSFERSGEKYRTKNYHLNDLEKISDEKLSFERSGEKDRTKNYHLNDLEKNIGLMIPQSPSKTRILASRQRKIVKKRWFSIRKPRFRPFLSQSGA
jgi:hypothetical protein